MVHLKKLHLVTATRNHVSGTMRKESSKGTSKTRPMLSRESHVDSVGCGLGEMRSHVD